MCVFPDSRLSMLEKYTRRAIAAQKIHAPREYMRGFMYRMPIAFEIATRRFSLHVCLIACIVTLHASVSSVYSVVKSVSFSAAWMADETDVDRRLKSMREALSGEIRKGKRIQI